MPSVDDITAAFTANPGLAVYSEGPRHFERIAGPVGGAALMDAPATVLSVGLVRRPAQRSRSSSRCYDAAKDRRGLRRAKAIAMVKKNRKEKIRDLAKSYEPTPQERAALEAYRIQEEDSPLAPRLRVTENDGATTICPDHPKPTVGNVLLMDALGTRDGDFLEGLLLQLVDAGSKGRKGRPDTEFHA